MPTPAERVCRRLRPGNCIAMRPEVELYLLDPGILGLSQLYRCDLVTEDPVHTNASRRHDAYRQYVLWRHGRLGAGVRRVISSCMVWRIRVGHGSFERLHEKES